VCGKPIEVEFDVPLAPELNQHELKCEECYSASHVLVTACPECKEAVRSFVSDLDFPAEIQGLAEVYVGVIRKIRDSLSGVVEEFRVSLPKRWTVKLACECGNEYTTEIPLPKLDVE
jgi:hypothetical protein